jgi:DNA-binding NtrC family response regulator
MYEVIHMADMEIHQLQMDLLFSVFDALPFPAVLINRDGETAYANAACSLAETDLETFAWNGLPAFALCAADNPPKGGIQTDSELLGVPGRLELYPMREDGGAFLGAVSFFHPAPKSDVFAAWFKSAPMQALAERLKRSALMRSPLMICGLPGTGQPELARMVHDMAVESKTTAAGSPFETVHCRQDAASVERALFGVPGEPGALIRASTGTLLLDSADALPLSIQTRLLDVMRRRTVPRPGFNDNLPWNAHVISTVGSEISSLATSDTFLEDFLLRISVISVTVPPLRERADDLPMLCDAYLRALESTAKVSPDALRAMAAYAWPGNLTELRQVLSEAAQKAGAGAILPEHLPFHAEPGQTLHQMEAQFSRNRARELVAMYGDTTEGKQRAAAELGISLSTLYRRLSKYS